MSNVDKNAILQELIDEMDKLPIDYDHTMGHGVELCIAIVESKMDDDSLTPTDKRYNATVNMLRAQGRFYDREYFLESIRIITNDVTMSREDRVSKVWALMNHPSVRPRP